MFPNKIYFHIILQEIFTKGDLILKKINKKNMFDEEKKEGEVAQEVPVESPAEEVKEVAIDGLV